MEHLLIKHKPVHRCKDHTNGIPIREEFVIKHKDRIQRECGGWLVVCVVRMAEEAAWSCHSTS